MNSRVRPSDEVLRLKREKLIEIDRDWRSFTDYILHSVFLRACADVNENATSKLQRHLVMTKEDKLQEDISHKNTKKFTKKEVLNHALCDGSNEETLQLAFFPNEFPYNLENGFHWTLWYNTPTQPYDNERITEDIIAKLRGCQDRDEEIDFGWYVTLLNFLNMCVVNLVSYCDVIQTLTPNEVDNIFTSILFGSSPY